MAIDDLPEKKRMTAESLKKFTRAVPAPTYHIGIRFPDGSIWKRKWSRPQLIVPENVGFLRKQNTGNDAAIFIRPATLNWALVDFDEDGYERLRAMVEAKEDVRFAAETSPWHVQAWVYLGPRLEVTEDQQRERAIELAMRFGGDPGSARLDQLGRAPGFFNRKPKYRDDHGWYPRVQKVPCRLRGMMNDDRFEGHHGQAKEPLAQRAARAPRWKSASISNAEIGLRGWIATVDTSRSNVGCIDILCDGEKVGQFSELPDLGDVRDAYNNALTLMRAEHHPRQYRSDGDVDRSRQDWDVAMYIQQCGYSYSYTVAAIALGSEKAAERNEEHRLAYAISRTDSAFNALAA